MASRSRRCQAASALKLQGDKPTGIRRHLEGWQLAPITLLMALFAALLALPRSAEPGCLPSPDVDASKIADIIREEQQRAARVRRTPLRFAVRAVGERVREYGIASLESRDEAGSAKGAIERAAARALQRYGAEPLLNLRAIQTELFLAALARWERTGVPDDELAELGGTFVQKAQANAWVDARGRLQMSELERRVVFRVRWGVLTALGKTAPFRSARDEWRVYYRFLLRHPEGGRRAIGAARARAQLSYVSALAKFDLDYPADFANGILFYRTGEYRRSMLAFQQHLLLRPEGRWTLRARNFWLSAARHGSGGLGE